MGTMEERWRQRQDQGQARRAEPLLPAGELDDQAWRRLQATHLQRQSSAIESIRTYVAVWFWLTIIGAVLIAISASRY